MITFEVRNRFKKSILGLFGGKKIFYEKNGAPPRERIKARRDSPPITLNDEKEFIKIFPGPNWSSPPRRGYLVNHGKFKYKVDFIFHGDPDLIDSHDPSRNELHIKKPTPPKWHLEFRHPNREVTTVDYGNVEVGEDRQPQGFIKKVLEILKNIFPKSK